MRFGLIWEEVELHWLRKFLDNIANENLSQLLVLDQPIGDVYRNHWSLGQGAVPGENDPDESVYLPGRNLMLLAKGAVCCSQFNLSVLLLGTLQGNPFPDARPEFFSLMEQVISLGMGREFHILTPFRNSTKEAVIQLAREAPLELSFSCIAPQDGQHCGRCNKCAERKKHFLLAGDEDKTFYLERSWKLRGKESW
jgi:7-cyano-7-deazaguanine synthase